MPEITDRGINALAAFVAEHRPDFDAPGVVAALRAERDSDVWQLAQRMLRRAADPSQKSPRLQAFDAPFLIGCPQHPGAAMRTDGTCAVCLVDRLADDSGRITDRGGRPIPADARRQMLAALRPETQETA